VAVPYHLDERLAGFDVGLPIDHEVTAELPPGGPWQRMAALYDRVAGVVGSQSLPVLVVSGDCTTSLGVLAGLQRAGHDVGIVWLDAHADFHTETTTTSGYRGGMPLALAVGVGTLTLPGALGLRPVPESNVVLVDARDTDPGEHILLERSSVRRTRLPDLKDAALPGCPLYLHLDIDVCDPEEVPGLLYPAPGGPALADVLDAVQRVMATGRVAAIGAAVTWRQDRPATPAQRSVMPRLREAITI